MCLKDGLFSLTDRLAWELDWMGSLKSGWFAAVLLTLNPSGAAEGPACFIPLRVKPLGLN